MIREGARLGARAQRGATSVAPASCSIFPPALHLISLVPSSARVVAKAPIRARRPRCRRHQELSRTLSRRCLADRAGRESGRAAPVPHDPYGRTHRHGPAFAAADTPRISIRETGRRGALVARARPAHGAAKVPHSEKKNPAGTTLSRPAGRRTTLAGIASLLVAVAESHRRAGAGAPSWPLRPVTISCNTASSSTDILARQLARASSYDIHRSRAFIVDNRAGANGNLGATSVAAAIELATPDVHHHRSAGVQQSSSTRTAPFRAARGTSAHREGGRQHTAAGRAASTRRCRSPTLAEFVAYARNIRARSSYSHGRQRLHGTPRPSCCSDAGISSPTCHQGLITFQRRRGPASWARARLSRADHLRAVRRGQWTPARHRRHHAAALRR